MGDAPSLRQLCAGVLNQPLAGSDERRMHRISELLAKAILMDAAKRVVDHAPAEAPSRVAARSGPATPETRIADYLSLVGEASPLTIRSALGLSRWGAHRALSWLLNRGDVTTNGHTRALVYRLARAIAPGFRQN